jgi:TRAP-type transport system periplasmic protein
MLKVKSIRKFVFAIIASFSMLLLAACGSEGDSHELIFSHFFPSGHKVNTDVIEPFTTKLEEQTEGRIKTEIYSSSALGDPASQYDMAVTGTADISLSVHGYTPGRFPLVSVMELPFISENATSGSKTLWTLYNEFEALHKEHSDSTPLWLFTAEPAQILTAKKPIERLEDMRGLTIRSPSPMGNKIIEALGATPVSMPMSEVYDALQKGVVDGALGPLSTAIDFNLIEVTNYITIGNFSMSPFFTTMNSDTWNSFSEQDQSVLEDLAGLEMATNAGQAFDARGEEAVAAAEKKGVKFIELTGGELNKWKDALKQISEDWVKEMEAKGLPGQAIYDRAVELGSK